MNGVCHLAEASFKFVELCDQLAGDENFPANFFKKASNQIMQEINDVVVAAKIFAKDLPQRFTEHKLIGHLLILAQTLKSLSTSLASGELIPNS